MASIEIVSDFLIYMPCYDLQFSWRCSTNVPHPICCGDASVDRFALVVKQYHLLLSHVLSDPAQNYCKVPHHSD